MVYGIPKFSRFLPNGESVVKGKIRVKVTLQ
jgi:hypothetical protein